MMDGSIKVESEPGKGSTFTFTVKLELPEQPVKELERPSLESIRGLRVLVVDDNPANRTVLVEMLRGWETLPTAVADGDAALRELQDAEASQARYDLVITDAHMPAMDGFDLVEKIRSRLDGRSTVIMMLTSGDHPGDASRCRELGIASHLLKPIKRSELFDAIALALGLAEIDKLVEAESAVAGTIEMKPLQILLAEDSLVNQRLATTLLKRHGHTVMVAKNGREALALLNANSFDVILMDVQMPELDGIEATARIRAKERLTGTHIPIVAMTAHALKGDRERCLQAGMDEYVSKPVRAAELFRTLQIVLPQATGLSPRSEVPSSKPVAAGRVVDWSEAFEGVGGDLALLRGLVEAALEEMPRQLAKIEKALAEGNAKSLKIAAHTLKGTVRYFGDVPLYGLALRMETLASEGKLDEAGRDLEAIRVELDRVHADLSDFAEGPGAKPGKS
jgi:CheY-like chemotaxis protein